jgi:hypothetical protein
VNDDSGKDNQRQDRLSAAEEARLDSWMLEIADEARGEMRAETGGWRFGANYALIVHTGGWFHDFSAGKGGRGALELIAHLKSGGGLHAAQVWLAQHQGDGRLGRVAAGDEGEDRPSADDVERIAYVRGLWDRAQPLSPQAIQYLSGRNLDPIAAGAAAQLRGLPNWRGSEGAMLAAVTDDKGELVALQVTHITEDGKKSAIEPVRITIRGPHDWRIRGAFRLGSAESSELVLVEGVEDAIAATMAGAEQVHASLGVGALGRAHLPKTVTRVTIARDDDPPGSPACQALGRGVARVLAQGREVKITPRAGSLKAGAKDLNDLLQVDVELARRMLTELGELKDCLDSAEKEALLDEVSRASIDAYENHRKAIADALGWRVSALDDDRDKRRQARATHNDPGAKRIEEAERVAARAAEAARLYEKIKHTALSKTLLADMVSVVHRLGVVREDKAISSTYIACTSRLLRRALSYLRRGAPASGKNYLISAILRLVPRSGIILISSATPMALIYYRGADDDNGEDEDDEGGVDALAHKIVVIAEAAVLARKANGDEHPMTGMLRILLSEGRLDHHIPIPQGDGKPPRTVHILRNGPIVLLLTSAREDVEAEMLTRLLSSDADESGEQTLDVITNALVPSVQPVGAEEIENWLDFQRYLECNAPYEVFIPFLEAISAAYAKLIEDFPATLQLRLRRDVNALITAVEASAVIHCAQRQRDATGRIVAELDDYRHVHSAFNGGMAALYDLQPSAAIAIALEAVIGVAEDEENAKGDQSNRKTYSREKSYRITVEAVRKRLGVASKETAAQRLQKLIDFGFIEENENLRGRGRGSPRYFKIQATAADGATPHVFPSPADVEARYVSSLEAVRGGKTPDKTNNSVRSPETNEITDIFGTETVRITPRAHIAIVQDGEDGEGDEPSARSCTIAVQPKTDKTSEENFDISEASAFGTSSTSCPTPPPQGGGHTSSSDVGADRTAEFTRPGGVGAGVGVPADQPQEKPNRPPFPRPAASRRRFINPGGQSGGGTP